MNPTLRDTLPHKETPFLRILHILVAVLVLAQIINSNFTESEALHESGLNGIVTWIHVISGFGLIFCGIAMMAWMLTQRGFKYYFAWLALDFRGIVGDIRTLAQRQLPDAHAGGMAARSGRAGAAGRCTLRRGLVRAERHARAGFVRHGIRLRFA